MPGADDALTTMRRRDRAVEDEGWIRDFLHRAPFGQLATVHDGQPFINSNCFVYDEDSQVIYLHTARYGRTRSNIESQERVCFNVSEMGRLLPADTAMEFSVEYAGVVILGRSAIVAEETEARHGLQMMLDKYCPHLKPGKDYHPITADELAKTSVFRVSIDQWSGKKKEADADHPGAFLYPFSRSGG